MSSPLADTGEQTCTTVETSSPTQLHSHIMTTKLLKIMPSRVWRRAYRAHHKSRAINYAVPERQRVDFGTEAVARAVAPGLLHAGAVKAMKALAAELDATGNVLTAEGAQERLAALESASW